ncbi:hypothetical protein EJ05DRAFT_481140 [Pseudovirgaria hyperparasitica]|uniref:Uncharacterized protein n=1 Tax=Pseudovirgaria hyperparasitica TaxID=470096 RepID=A0A6A6VPN9_9PEZI|nr:uncharacterized protein EJ05DRAFT_481140 [Pseudovirgaria hyperparasitica]KAF2752598.1 hypothetical protein EJ05DRAFT_481140 [Pseudovirgaria hyperparasitica]
MGVPHSTARVLAPLSFLYDFALQQYGMLSTPNMKTIHDRNISFFSPQPFFIAGFFFPQQLFQLVWLYRLYFAKGTKEELAEMSDFAAVYALGNVCIGTWMLFWNKEMLGTANVFVIINTLAQVGYMATRLKPMRTSSYNSMLTHIVSKTFAGIGVLDLLHNTSAAYFVNQPASTAIKVLTGLGFAGAAVCSDWIFGGCLVYDLIALSVGQSVVDPGWGRTLGGFAAGTAAIVGVKNWLLPPYVKGNNGYTTVEDAGEA